ncbi:hypothetical protein [uncultured Dokdonia sp.]|uniref:hypothetical protein n=1 Tax=uncultured Dokdonia sp. TaxID=575653 RepID=UPI00263398C0|nr:hypothetical protein [uncultured Dokdonia sp.]
MKKSIEILKSYFEKGDRPTQREFEDLIDSFLHKDDGVAIKDISTNADGDFVFALSDGTEQIITQSSDGVSNSVLTDLQNALDGKVDKVTNKQLSTEDFTTSLKSKLEQLENYVHPAVHQISEVENLQETIDTKLATTDVTKAALNGLEIRDENGVVQFTSDEYVELEGVSFDPTNNRIKFIDDATTYYYVHSVVGDDTTGGINNPSKPYKTIDGVFVNYDKTIDLDQEYIVIILVNQTTHFINERVPFLNVEFRSNLYVNISFTNNTNSGNLFYTNNGSRTIRWYFNIPNGRLIDNKTTGFSSLNTEDLICYFNVNEINISSPGGNSRYFGRTYYVEKINRLIMNMHMGSCRTRRLNFELIDATGYGANGALLQSIDSLGFEVTTNQLITGDVRLVTIVRSGKIAFERVSGNLRFHYSNSPITVEFLNTLEATVLLVQTVTQVTFTGHVKLLNFTGVSTNGAIDFVNLTVADSTGILAVNTGNLNYRNCSIVTDSYLMSKAGTGRVRIDNTTIRQKNPTNLINSTGSGITIDVGGFSTNATTLSNNANDTLIQDFRDFAEASIPGGGLSEIEVRDENGVAQFAVDAFIEFEGASFDSINKRVQFSSLSPYTIYVDSINGDDATAQLFNSDKPFKTFSAAKAKALPGVSTYYFLSSIVLDDTPTSSTYFYSDRAITIDFSNVTGRITGGTWYYHAPLSEFRHINTGDENPITFNFSNCHIVADRIIMNSNSEGSNNFLFDAVPNSNSTAYANEMIFGDGGGNRVRGCFKHYQVTCNVFTFSRRQYLTDSTDTGFYNVDTLAVSGTIGTLGIFPTARILSFKKMKGGAINWYGLYDDSKVVRETATINLRGNVDLTGHSRPGNTGNIIIFDFSFDTLNIFSFYGKISSKAAGNYAVYAGTKLNAKIKIYNSRIEADDDFLRHNPNSDNTNKEIIIKDSEFIFDTPDENIFKDTGTGINVTKIGTMLSNGGLGANVTINTTKLNAF